jgi:uncharacterized repeat protein (TIGR01451 family)
MDLNTQNNSATDTDTILRRSDLAITKTDGNTLVARGMPVTYTIVVSNNGPDSVVGAIVNDSIPAGLTGASWTCTASAGSTCVTAGGTGSINNRQVNLLVGGSATFMLNATVASNAGLSISNTATVTAPSGTSDSITANNSATDTNAVNAIHVGDLDWTNAVLSGTQWRAFVTITVHDSNHNPIANAVVTGTWSAGNTTGRTLTCITNATGQCTVQSGQISRGSVASVTFTVTSVSNAAYPYQSGANHDPDGAPQNSTGTAVIVPRP